MNIILKNLNSIYYNVKFLGGYKVSKATMEVYVNDVYSGDVLLTDTKPFDTYSGSFELTVNKNMTVKLIIKNCVYNGVTLDVDASYKFKL